jgi:hypothetical protein
MRGGPASGRHHGRARVETSVWPQKNLAFYSRVTAIFCAGFFASSIGTVIVRIPSV